MYIKSNFKTVPYIPLKPTGLKHMLKVFLALDSKSCCKLKPFSSCVWVCGE